MSEVGDYVHLHLSNYRKYGITKKQKQSGVAGQAQAIYNNQKTVIKQFVQNKNINLKDIENKLNDTHGLLTDEGVGDVEKKKNEVLNELVDQFHKDLEARTGQTFSINRNTLSVYAQTGFSESQFNTIAQKHQEAIKKFKSNPLSIGTGTYKTIRISTLKSRIRELNNIKRTLINDLQLPADKNELIKLIDQINVKYSEIYKELAKSGENTSLPRNAAGLRGNKNGLIALINKAYSEIRLKQVPNESGKLAELAAGVMLNMNTFLAASNVKESVANFIKDIEGSLTYDKGYVDSNFKDFGFIGSGNSHDSVTIKLPSTNIDVNIIIDTKHKGQQGKIDFRFKDNNSNIVGVSHKAYFLNDKPTIHINSGSNMLMMMQQYPDFANHYLNVMSSHPDASVMNLSGLRQAAKEAMKLTILAYSLSGGFVTDKGIMDKADVLTVFNKSTQTYHAFSIHSILNKAALNIDSYLALDNELEELPNYSIDSKKLGQGSNQARIQNLLSYLRAVNISASIKTSALNL